MAKPNDRVANQAALVSLFFLFEQREEVSVVISRRSERPVSRIPVAVATLRVAVTPIAGPCITDGISAVLAGVD